MSNTIKADIFYKLSNLNISASKTVNVSSIPENISKWLKDLTQLKNVPFHILVPDENMLPSESLRFFYVDPNWIAALIDGAFSVGKFSSVDKDIHATTTATISQIKNTPKDYKNITGFLLRSELVKGWPGLEINAYQKDTDIELERIRIDHLAQDVILALFDGEIGSVSIHEPAEAMHFGLDIPDDPDQPGISDPLVPKNYYKELRKVGSIAPKIKGVPSVFRSEQKLVLDITAMATSIQNGFPSTLEYSSADFAFQMVEGVGQVTFNIK